MAKSFSVSVTGIDKLLKQLDPKVVNKEIDKVTETYARKMANAAAMKAPRKDGWLKNSLVASVKSEGNGVWSWGSDLPYALRQEYEHATARGFVRKSIWEYRNEYREAVRVLLRGLGAK